MSGTPGFGGYTAGQQQRAEKAIKENSAWEKAMEAAGAEIKKWSGPLDDFHKRIAEEAKRIRNPIPPTFEPITPPAEKRKFDRPDSDALVAVGNFLGAGRTNSMQRIAEQQLEVQRDMRNLLREMATNGDAGFGGVD